MRKFIFRFRHSLGNIVLLTAAVRDLHRIYPGLFQTDVRTTFQDLWLHNPHLTPLGEYDPAVTVVDCQAPQRDTDGITAGHRLHGFMEFLNRSLGTQLKPTEFRGDVHLSRGEKAARPVAGLVGDRFPFWLISNGGSLDHTVKWWDIRRYQKVVDHFRGRIQFVQVGDPAHHHSKLRGVIDLRGQTSLRDLARLVHQSQGVLCGVGGLMHLAAAVPLKSGSFSLRPCVVIAGGRQSAHWEAYPGHQFLQTVGALPCCARGGCWRSRVTPLGDESGLDEPEELCVDVRAGLPRCMDLITVTEVVRRIETFFEGGTARYLRQAECRAAGRGVKATARYEPEDAALNQVTAIPASERFIASIPEYPGGYHGRGIVIGAGGPKVFANAWVCVRVLRRLGCALPIQLWHLGPGELDDSMRTLVAPLGVECVDAHVVCRRHPVRLRRGWPLKPFALAHCPFEQVLLLDADNIPVRNPEFLFDSPQFRRTGAVFWPDAGPPGPPPAAWNVFGARWRREPSFEIGQMLLNKRRCWKPLRLALWYNEHSDFYFEHVYGDKDTFHMAFRKLGQPFAMPTTPARRLRGAICQHDFQGRRLFQHRQLEKWSLFPVNRPMRGFMLEKECLASLDELRAQSVGTIKGPTCKSPSENLFALAGRHLDSSPKIVTCMASCRQRDEMRRRTLARLSQTDWGHDPVQVYVDEKRFRSSVENLSHTAWRAFHDCLQTDADYVLYLEDDLEFNLHLRHNLRAWPPLLRGEVTLATLYNPRRREIAWDLPRQAVELEAASYFGSQALLVSRAAMEYFLRHWFDGPDHLDLKLVELLVRAHRPLLAHCPSLVQHVGRRSIWGGRFHQASDFQRDWKAAES